MKERTYDFSQTLADLDAGVFLEKISRAIKDTAIGTVNHGENRKRGRVIIELSMERIGESSQVTMTHKLKYERPTKRGKFAEEDATETALYVSPRIGLSIMPENQTDWLTSNNKEEA